MCNYPTYKVSVENANTEYVDPTEALGCFLYYSKRLCMIFKGLSYFRAIANAKFSSTENEVLGKSLNCVCGCLAF